jgi:hypothetical protein
VAESSEEGCGSKRAHLPMMITMMMIILTSLYQLENILHKISFEDDREWLVGTDLEGGSNNAYFKVLPPY